MTSRKTETESDAMIKAVIFDMDGVLIDSEIVYLRHQTNILQKTYPWIKETHLYPLVGMDSKEDKVYLADLLGRDANDPAFLRELHEISCSVEVDYRAIMRIAVPSLLAGLKKDGYRIALASSSPRSNIMQVMAECGIGSCFECIVSGEQFARSKPDPEIYFFTMNQIGVQPEECLIVEDSTYGVQAGSAAGAHVAALKDPRFPFDQSQAEFHISSLEEIQQILNILQKEHGR